MKKFLFGLIIGLILATSGIAGAADELVKIFINGRQFQTDTEPVIINGRVFVPLRALCESLGIDVQWVNTTRTVMVRNNSKDEIINNVKPATVKILSLTNANSLVGSGFNIDPAGLIITNAHVVNNSKDITITFLDDKKYKAYIKAVDSNKDIAVLELYNKATDLPAIVLGDSRSIKLGDEVMVFGYPLGAFISVTTGTVGNLKITDVENFTEPLMQINANINKGNSGGPVVDSSGKVIGITTGYFESQNGDPTNSMGAAIPINEAKPLLL